MEKCQCSEPQYCSRFNRVMDKRYWEICQGISGLSIEDEQKYLERLAGKAINSKVAKQQSLTTPEAVAQFTKALISHFIAGRPKCTDAQYQNRIIVCDTCEHCDKSHSTWVCKICSCNLKEGGVLPSKARWATEDCPVGKWPKLSLPLVNEPESNWTPPCGSCHGSKRS